MFKNIVYITKLLFFATVLFGPTGLHITYAQALAVKVQPSMIDEVVDAGQVLEGSLTVTNENGGEQTYYIDTRNVVGMNDTGTPEFSEEHSDDPLEASAWFDIPTKQVTVAVGESVHVPYSIKIPENVSPGSYFAAFFITREADKMTQSGAGVCFHVASLVNLRIRGDVNEDMLFREFFTERSFFTGPSVIFGARVDNTGTVHQRPLGIIAITDMFGRSVGQVKFNENSGAILPHNDRVFEAVWNYDGFALGRYTAVASILYGETKKNTLTREVSFWVVPVKEVGIVLGAIIAILLVFVYGVKRYVRNALKNAGHVGGGKVSQKNVTLAKRMVRTLFWLIGCIVLVFMLIIVYNA